MNFKISSVIQNQYAVLQKLKIVTIVLLFAALSFSTLGATFRVIINPGENETECTFEMNPGESMGDPHSTPSVPISGTNDSSWNAGYDVDGNFSVHCWYKGWNTFKITSDGTYYGTIAWVSTYPVKIVASEVPGAPVITSESTKIVSPDEDLDYTITTETSAFDLTYNDPTGLPEGLTYTPATHKVTGSLSAGTYTFTVSATNAAGTSSQLVTVRVGSPPSITSSSYVIVNQDEKLAYTITATGSPTSYSVAAIRPNPNSNLQVTGNAVNINGESNYTEINDKYIIFSVSATNAYGTSNSRLVTAKYQGRVEISLYNDADTDDIDADGKNPQGFSLVTGTVGNATFSLTNSEYFKVYTDSSLQTEFTTPGENPPGILYLQALAPIDSATATISRDDLFPLSDTADFSITMDGPDIDGRIGTSGAFVDDGVDDDADDNPANLVSTGGAGIELRMNKGGAELGDLKLEFSSSDYDKFCDVYYDSGFTPAQLVGEPPYSGTIVASPTGLAARLCNGSLFIKALAPVTDGVAKLTYTNSSGYTVSDEVHFNINMTNLIGITGYTDLSGNTAATELDGDAITEHDPTEYTVTGPFKIVLSRGDLLAGTVTLKVSADGSGTTEAAKFYTDSSLTTELSSMSVDLYNPTGGLSDLATNGSITLYVMPLIPTDSLNIDLEYANGATLVDRLKIGVGMIGVNITGYKGTTAIPEEEEYPSDLSVPVYDKASVDAGTTPAYVKVKLERGSLVSGKIKFSISHETGKDRAVEVYLDENLTKPLKDREVDIVTPTGDLKPLGNGEAGDMFLYIKPIGEASKVTAKIIYEDGSTSADEFSFKICSECPCTGCPPGKDGDDSIRDANINSKFSLGSNSYGRPAGSIYLTSSDLSMDMAGPDALQIVPFQGTTIAYTYDPNDSTIVTDIDIDTGVTEINISFTTATHGTKYYTSNVMSFCHAGETTPYRTVTITNDYDATDQGGGVYTFDVNYLNISNALTLPGPVVVTKTAKYEKPDVNTWKLTRNGTIIEYLKTIVDSNAGTKTETYYVGSMTSPVYKDTNVYKIYPWGDALIQNIGAETTTYTYYDNNSTDGMKLGNLKKITYPKGDTVEYTYGVNGNLLETITNKGGHTYKATREVSQLAKVDSATLPTTFTISPMTGCFDYSTVPDTSTLTLVGTKEVTKQYFGTTLISHSESINYYDHSAGVDTHTVYDNTTAYTTTTEYYSDDTDTTRYGRVKKVVNSDSTIAIYDYTRSGGQETVTTYSGEPNTGGTAVINGSKNVSVYGKNGVIVSSTSYAIVASALTQIASATTTDTDDFGRVTETTYMDSTTTERSYGCCGVDWEIDRNGVRTDYTYDAASKLMDSSERDGITTFYDYDQAGNTLSVTVKGSSNGELETTNVYNQYGVMTSSTDPMEYTTTYTYANDKDTVTYPNGTTSITNYTGGVVTSTSGTAVHGVTYSFGANTQTVTPANITTHTDMLGRQYKTVFADNTESLTEYNSKGQAVEQTSPAGKITLTEYDSIGRVYRSVIDMDKDGVVNNNDEITQYTYAYGTHSSKTVSVTTVTRIVNTNSKVLSVSETTLDGMESWTTVNGLVTHSLTERQATAGELKTTIEYPDGSKTITTTDHGLTEKIESFQLDGTTAGNVVEYTYDEFDRLDTVTEKFGETVINKVENTAYNNNGQPLTVTSNDRATTYVYNNMGQRTSVTLPGSRTVTYTYKPTGELDTVDGADTYKQSYDYDSQGRMSKLSTYKSGTTAQDTTWGYNTRGFMTSKTYADSNGTAYSYTDDGQLHIRTWDRLDDGQPLTTTYSYDNAGRQLGIDYSDSTPDITYTYDWMGNPATVVDAEGTRDFTYNYTTTGHPGLVSVEVPGIVDHSLNYTYDSYGRRTAMSLDNNSNPVFTNNYGYDTTSGKLATIGDGTYTANYTYHDGTGLLTQNQIKLDSTSAVVTTHNRTYDARTNNYHLLTTANTTGATTRTYTYVYNTKDQRTKLTLADGTYWEYTYDDKGQVTGGVKKDASDNLIAGQHFGYSYDGIGNRVSAETKLSALQLQYITNDVNQYTQINTPGIVPVLGEADTDTTIQAVRTDASNLTGGKQKTLPTRSGKYFSGAFTDIDNTTAAQTIGYDVYAIKTDPNDSSKQLIHKESSTYTVPKAAATLTYDPDGNMTSEGNGWNYTWNGENRMIEAVKTDDTKIEFKHDFMGRRFEKKKYSWVSSAWQLDTTEKYVWNGYNIIAIYNASTTLQKTMLYGLDINGGLQTAGGVGGLLFVNDVVNTKTYLPIYDGNGNVRVYLDSSDGTKVAEYDYDPGTNFTIKTGTKADELAAIGAFSTMPFDPDAKFIRWPFRIGQGGRFLSRDPKDEFGFRLLTGINLDTDYEPEYVLTQNDTINKSDYLGLFIILLSGNHPVSVSGKHHSKLWLFTDEDDFVKKAEKAKFKFNNYKKSKCKYIAIGAGMDGLELLAAFNRETDVNDPFNNKKIVTTFSSHKSAITLLKNIHTYNSNMNSNFKDTTLHYDLFPGTSYTSWDQWNAYNSNTYISGLLIVLGYPVPSNGGVSTPGYSKPIPRFVFKKKFANTKALKKEFKKNFPGF